MKEIRRQVQSGMFSCGAHKAGGPWLQTKHINEWYILRRIETLKSSLSPVTSNFLQAAIQRYFGDHVMRKSAYIKEKQKKYRKRETAAKKAILEAQTFHNRQFSIISEDQKSYDIFKLGDWVNLRFQAIDNNREWNLVRERAQIS